MSTQIKVLRVGCYDPDIFDFDTSFKPKPDEEYSIYNVGGRYVLNSKDGYSEITDDEFNLGFYIIDEKPYTTYLEEYSSIRKRKVIAPWHTVPKTIREAEEWAKSNLNIEHVDYSGFDVRLASDFNFQLWKLQRFYPEVPRLKWLSTSRIAYRANFEHKLMSGQKSIRKRREKRNSDAWARSFAEHWGDQQGIVFNAKYVKDYDDLRSRTYHCTRTGWHPPNCTEPAQIISHEFAHQIDDFLRREGLRERYIEPLWEKYKDKAEKLISRYAATNSKEFFAESFAEFIHADYDEYGNFVCRPVAIEVMESLNNALQEYRNQRGLSFDWGRESDLPQFGRKLILEEVGDIL